MENKTTWKENRPIACLVLVLAVWRCVAYRRTI